MDWKNKKLAVGTEVKVFDVDHKPLGVGTLLHEYDAESEDNLMPEIRMPDGRIILGCECWWIPVAETTDITH